MLLLSSCLNKDEVALKLIEYHNNDWQKVQEIKDEKMGSKISDYISFALDDNEEEIAKLLSDELLPSFVEVIDYLESIELEH